MVVPEVGRDGFVNKNNTENGSLPQSAKTVKRRGKSKPNVPEITDKDGNPGASVVSFRKNIGFFTCLGLLVGSIIGSGIFVSPKGVLIGSGSIGVSMIVWALCGVMTLTGSLAFAELGTMLPNSGGQYYYLLEAFNPKRKEEKSFWKSLLPFLFFWQFSLLNRPATIAIQGMTIGQYIIKLAFLNGCDSTLSKENTKVFARLLSVLFIMMITAVNCYSNKLSTKLVNIFAVAKLIAIAFVIVSGLTFLSLGTSEALSTGFEGTTLEGIAGALYSGLFAYQGWDKLNMVARELVNPKRDLLRALIATCVIVTSIVLLMNISYFALLSKESFLASDAVAADFADNVIGKPGKIFIIISVVCSIFGSGLGGNFTANRVMYAAAREGHMADFFCFIHYQRMTPSTAVMLTGAISIMLSTQSSVLGLISLSGFVFQLFMFLTMVALLILRKNGKRDKDDFQAPFVCILINMILAVVLVIIPFVREPKLEYIFVVVILLVGIHVYTVFVHYRKAIPGFSKCTMLVQKILEVAPPEDDTV